MWGLRLTSHVFSAACLDLSALHAAGAHLNSPGSQFRLCTTASQAAYRGKLARRAVFHTLVVPRMLEAGLRRKRQIEASRWG